MESGIYLITNRVNGKMYVGSAQHLMVRKSSHWSLLKHGKHSNPHLQRAYSKHGEAAFCFSILEYCSRSELVEREHWWMELLETRARATWSAARRAAHEMNKK